MNAILRIINNTEIKDIDLSTTIQRVDFGDFCIYKNGKWLFSCRHTVMLNGNPCQSGALSAGDMITIDFNTHTAAMVLAKINGAPKFKALVSKITLGRASDNTIVFHDSTVSAHHCEIISYNGAWYVHDLESTNGTIVNNVFVSKHILSQGDIIKLGSYCMCFGNSLCVQNADENVIINEWQGVAHTDFCAPTVAPKITYPFHTRSPRLLTEPTVPAISIENAPTIGDKPSMAMGGIPLSAQMLAVSIGMQALKYGMSRKKYKGLQQKRAEIYANYLASVEEKIIAQIRLQAQYMNESFPMSGECLAMADPKCTRLWERHPSDKEFLSLRLGVGRVRSAVNISVPAQHLKLFEDELDSAPQAIADKYTYCDGLPIVCSIKENGNCGFIGSRSALIDYVFSAIIQIAALHSYDEVKIVALFPEQERTRWQWLRWLPHCMTDDHEMRFLAANFSEARPVMDYFKAVCESRRKDDDKWSFGRRIALPYYIVIVGDPDLLYNSALGEALVDNDLKLGICGLFLGEALSEFPHSVKSIVRLSSNGGIYILNGNNTPFSEDKRKIAPNESEFFARKLSPIRLKDNPQKHFALPRSISLLGGLGLEDINKLDLHRNWTCAVPEKSLSVPIGVRVNGELFEFDIHESAHGPHGIVAGGTGSGKSQMAQTWIASMAMSFSPSDVNFILVDFKGDSLLQPFRNLPHIAGTISNLDKDIFRSFIALESEMERRQRLFAEHGCKDIIDYLVKRRKNPDMPQLPYLILIIDEYAEFKAHFPDFIKPIEHLYAAGRSLGVFAVLMTQHPSGVVTEQMRANAQFRWCLSVKSDADSRAVIDIPDAAYIKNPGRAYVQSGKDSCELIQSLYCGATYIPQTAAARAAQIEVSVVELNGTRHCPQKDGSTAACGQKTELDVIVEYIAQYCRNKHIRAAEPIWKEELPTSLDLDALIPAHDGWSLPAGSGAVAVVGMVDDPKNQRQDVVSIRFRQSGNVAVYGMPVSGKTTFLKTMIQSICECCSPKQAQFYILECGGYTMRAFDEFPHVGAVCGDDEPETVTKVISLVGDILEERKKLYKGYGVSSPQDFFEVSGNELPDIVMAVDNLNILCQTMPEVVFHIIKISSQGPSYGIFLACSFAGTTGVNYQLSQNISSVFCMQLADKSDYISIVGRINGTIAERTPGRGYMRQGTEPLLFQTAIFCKDITDGQRTLEMRSCARRMSGEWRGERPVGVRVMPQEIPFGSICADPVVLGLDTADIEPVRLELTELLSLMVSCCDAEAAQSFAGLCAGQACAVENSEVILCGDSGRFIGLRGAGVQITDCGTLPPIVERVAEELRLRQKKLRESPQAEFAPIVIILSEFNRCMTELPEETTARLEVFIRLGKGLNITVISIDTAPEMTRAIYSARLLSATMKAGARLVIGGKLADHQIIDAYAICAEHPQPLQQDEACLCAGDKNVFLKLMSDERR